MLHAGVRVFERDASIGTGCGYRVVQEGAPLLLPYMSRRALQATPAAMAALLRAHSCQTCLPLPVPTALLPGADESAPAGEHCADRGGEPGAAGRAVSDSDRALLAPLVRDLAGMQPNGCCVFACDNGRGTARLAVTGMKYTDKLVLFISAGERTRFLDDLAAYY